MNIARRHPPTCTVQKPNPAHLVSRHRRSPVNDHQPATPLVLRPQADFAARIRLECAHQGRTLVHYKVLPEEDQLAEANVDAVVWFRHDDDDDMRISTIWDADDDGNGGDGEEGVPQSEKFLSNFFFCRRRGRSSRNN